jgi:hypothetical protein
MSAWMTVTPFNRIPRWQAEQMRPLERNELMPGVFLTVVHDGLGTCYATSDYDGAPRLIAIEVIPAFPIEGATA